MSQEYTVKRKDDNVHEVRFRWDKDRDEWWVLLTADRHWDHPYSDHDLQIEHLQRAQELGAPVIDLGDLFCAMQGKHDPRRSYTNLKEAHKEDNYLDLVVDDAVDFFAPYADAMVLVATGNHEQSVKKNANTDLGRRLCARLSRGTDHRVDHTAMTGWVQFKFEHAGGGNVITRNLYYHHGWGGSARVTKGVIKTNRRAAMLANADVVATGHIHESWEVNLQREWLKPSGEIEMRDMLHVQVPSYKEEWERREGFHVEKGRAPKPVGARWLVFRRRGRDIRYSSMQAQ